MRITLVAAMSLNRVIGNRGQLPWRLPADLARFKRLTMNHAVIMGRKTFDSIQKPLPGRSNIVITRQRGWNAPFGGDVTVAHNLTEAMAQARQLDESTHHQNEIMILGGAEIYRQAMPLAHSVQLTVVEADFEGDAFFPDFDPAQWTLAHDEPHTADERNPSAMRFQEWVKATPKADR
jgi:dihydrofolate reductase